MKKFSLVITAIVLAFGFFSTPASAAQIDHVWYDTQPDGTVIQTIQFHNPQVYKLNFRYCDGLSCGNPQDPDLDCYVNKYNPQFPSPTRNLTITPPVGSTAKKIFLKAGSLPGFTSNYGYFDADTSNDWNQRILGSAPVLNPNGSVALNFDQPNFMGAMTISPLGRVCGLSEEEYKAFQNQYGSENDDKFYQSAIKISIVWSPPIRNGLTQTTIDIDGQQQTDQWVYVPPQTPTPVATIPSFNPNQSFLNGLFGTNGTIPALVSTLMNNLGANTSPETLANTLKQSNVATDTGYDWKNLKSAVTTQQPTYVTKDVTASEAFRGAESGKPYLTALTTQTKTGPVQSNVILTGYSSSKDQVNLLQTDGKKVTMPASQFLKGQPWIMDISQQTK